MQHLTTADLATSASTSTAVEVTPSPAPTFRRGAKPASEAAISFLRKLVAERAPEVSEDYVQSVIDQGSARVSAAIDRLQAMPKVAIAPVPAQTRTNRYAGTCEDCGTRVEAGEGTLARSDAGRWEVAHRDGDCPVSEFPFPVGRYAVENAAGELRFFVADHEGLFAQASDELYPIAASQAAWVIAAISADPEAASTRYGQELGVCGRCNRTLTDETSRAAGIGPVCATKGW